jgi:hypothetical protein
LTKTQRIGYKIDKNHFGLPFDFFTLTLIKGAEMKRIITIVAVVTLMATTGILSSGAQDGQKLYTSYNIWKASKMQVINFKEGHDIIPAGTEVKDTYAWPPNNSTHLRFTTVEDNHTYTLGFVQRWHPRKDIKDYLDKMFTKKTFEDLTNGLTETEISAIKKGVLVNGMSKRAVLICYGIPPEHYTPNQNADKWYYWKNRGTKITLIFDENDMLVMGGKESKPVISKGSDIETKLKKLGDLRDKDLITQEEYDKKKAKLLEEF